MAKSYVETVRTKKNKDGTIEKKKCLVVDMSKVTDEDMRFITLKGNTGYEIVQKENKTEKNGLKLNELLYYINNFENEKELVEKNSNLKDAINNGNYMKIKSAYKNAKFGKVSDNEKKTKSGQEKVKKITEKFKALEEEIKKYYKDTYKE